MKLSELIQHVGDDNVVLQNIMHSSPTLRLCEKDGQITFCTDKGKVRQLMHADSAWTALVVWLPTERLPDVKDENNQTDQRP
jgi:hypothetical protein